MSPAAREQRILDAIGAALQAGEIHLTSMFAIFTRLHDSLGSTATTRHDGLRSRKHWPTPTIVPPVPTPPATASGAR